MSTRKKLVLIEMNAFETEIFKFKVYVSHKVYKAVIRIAGMINATIGFIASILII